MKKLIEALVVSVNLSCLIFISTIIEISAQTIEFLKVGDSFEKELSGGEAQEYKVQSGADFYLRVVVEQKGIDVVVTLFDQTKNKVAEINNSTATQGAEILSFITVGAGEYTLQIKSLDKAASKGVYKLGFEELTLANEKHLNRFKADKLFAEAEQLKLNQTAESFQKALLKYDEAGKLYQLAADVRGEATALNNSGEILYALGMPEKALENFKKALPLFIKINSRSDEASVRSNIGAMYGLLGDAQKAIDSYLPAAEIFAELKDQVSEATVRSNLAVSYTAVGKNQEALATYQRALELCQLVCDKRSSSILANNIGSLYDSSGNYQKAIEYYLQALPAFRDNKDRRTEGIILNNIGSGYRGLGEIQNAIDYYLQALPILKELGDKSSEAYTLNNLGDSYAEIGNYADAEKKYEESLKLFQEIKDRRGEMNVLSNLGVLYYTIDNHPKALEYYLKALPIARENANKPGEARALYYLGQNYIELNDLPKAKEHLLQSLTISRETGDKETESRSLLELSVLEQKNDNLSQSLSYIEEAVKIVEDNRAQIIDSELRVSYFALFQNYYELYINALMQSHRQNPNGNFSAKAFEVSERSRSRGLMDLLSESRIDVRQGVDTVLLEKEKQLRQQISAIAEKLFRRGTTEQERARSEKDLRELKVQLQQVTAEIKIKSPQYAALSQPTLLSVSDVQNLLDENTVLLEYSLGIKQSYLWVIEKNQISSFSLPPRQEIENKAKKVYELLTSRQPLANETTLQTETRVKKSDAEYPKFANELSQTLLGAVYPQIKNKRLLIVADGTLQYIPFSALPAPSDKTVSKMEEIVPLVVNNEIVNLASASLLPVLQKGKSARSQKTVITIADAVFDEVDTRVKNAVSKVNNENKETRTAQNLRSFWNNRGGLRRLIFSRDEANAITLLAPSGNPKPVLDFDANLSKVLSEDFSKYSYVHFATHGILDSQNPELSGIVLSLIDQNGNARNGFLGLSDIYNLKMPVELVVLSACQTALGKNVRGEGLIGLTRGFMYSGAKRVVASLWSVNDNSTAQLMKKMYAKILKEGATPASALRQAQIEMWQKKQNNHPFYWAAFTIQGDFR